MAEPIEKVLPRLKKVTKTSRGWRACCPAHLDHNPSLDIDLGPDGKVLMCCRSRGCAFGDIVAALGLEPRDLMPGDSQVNGRAAGASRNGNLKPKTSSNGNRPASVYSSLQQAQEGARRSAEIEVRKATEDPKFTVGAPDFQWRYDNAEGEAVGWVLRWNFTVDGGKGKVIRPLARVEGGWMVKAMPEPRPLLGLSELLARDDPIFIVEGEKCVDAVRSLGLTATTFAGGSKVPQKSDWTPLDGRGAIYLVDADDPGRACGQQVARLAWDAGVHEIHIVELPDLRAGGDVFDWVECYTDRDVEELRDLLLGYCMEQPTWQPPEDGDEPVEDADWPEPAPLPESLPEVAPFHYDLLPEGLRQWVEDIAERTQCPPDFPAVGIMVGLASLVGRKIRIRPKRHDDWTVTPNLWGAVVGRPGIMKTPALSAVTAPLRRIEIAAREDYQAAVREHEAAKLVAEQERKAGQSRIKDALKNGGDARAVAMGIINQTEAAETPPARRRYITNDSTVEKLGEILADNPNGVLVFRDELTGFLRGLDREGQESARAFYLESWNGDGRYTCDRIGRGTIDIEAAITSILGGIQPGPLSDYVRGAASDGRGADGLLQRFQLVVWPDISREWKNIDRWPDTEIKNRAHAICDRLDSLTPEECDCEYDGDISFLRFTPEAQERFDEWRGHLELRLRADIEHPAFEAHLSKYRSLIPSIALLCHLVEDGHGPVGLDALDRAIRWGEYLESHARRLYGSAINADVESAHALAKRIKAGELSDGFTLREVYQHHWSGLASRDDARRAAEILVDHDILREETDSTGGRPKTRHWINARFL